MTYQGPYEKEIAPLVQALLEKARKQNIPCLFAVQVEGVVRISGNLVDASPQMQEAFAILFQEEEPHNGPMTRGSDVVE